MVARRLGRLHRPGIRVCGAGLVGPTQPTDFVGRLTRRLGRLHRPSVRMFGAGLVGPTHHTAFVGRLARVGWVGFSDPAIGCAELGWWGETRLWRYWVGVRTKAEPCVTYRTRGGRTAT